MWSIAPPVAKLETSLRARILKGQCWDLAYLASCPHTEGRALDIGANIGVYSSVLAKSHSLVDSFEPNPRLARRLGNSCASNVTVWPCALSGQSGSAELAVPRNAGTDISGLGTLETSHLMGSAVSHFRVTTLPLDSFGYSDVRLLKIDVEGHELSVLSGAHQLLSEANDVAILIEAEERHSKGSPYAVRNVLERYGFSGRFVHRGQLLDVQEFDPAFHQAVALLSNTSAYSNVFFYSKSISQETTDRLARAAQHSYHP